MKTPSPSIYLSVEDERSHLVVNGSLRLLQALVRALWQQAPAPEQHAELKCPGEREVRA